jgi:phage shock protein C
VAPRREGESEETMKRIYRDEDHAKIAGICAGLGEVFHMDATLLRLALVFLTVVTGFIPMIVTYLVGWAIIPEKRDIPDDGDVGGGQ